MIHGQKLRPGIASRENGQGMGPGRVNRGPQVQCTFLNWVPQVHLGFLVVTAYNSCILINALLWVPLLSSASISQGMWFMRARGLPWRATEPGAGGWRDVGTRVERRCPWGVGGRGGHQSTWFVKNLKHNKSDWRSRLLFYYHHVPAILYNVSDK